MPLGSPVRAATPLTTAGGATKTGPRTGTG